MGINKMFKLIATATLVITLAASAEISEKKTEHESPVVEAAMFYDNGWGIYDFLQGFVMGAYGPLLKIERDSDCFSMWFDLGVRSIDFSKFFDKPFPYKKWGSWMGMFWKMFWYIFALIKTPSTCIRELNYAKEYPWHEDFGFMTKFISEDINVKLPVVGEIKRSGSEIGQDIGYIFSIGIGTWGIYNAWASEFHYWAFGYKLGKTSFNILKAINWWGQFEIFPPMPAHERYLDKE